MFFLTVLGSGSAGNCALVESSKTRILIDGGLSARQMAVRLAACGINPLEIDGILLTHEHGDHAAGLKVWCRQFSTPIYGSRLTAEAWQQQLKNQPGRSAANDAGRRHDWRCFVSGGEFAVGDITIQSFPVPHDAAEPCGFALHHGSASLGFLTDLGFATKLVHERIRQVHTLVIETNHDEKLLQDCTRRPWSVKQRIMSRHGHLSNAAAASVLGELAGANLRRAVLGHLSRDCNSPELAIGAARARFACLGAEHIEVVCATQREATPRFAIG